MGCVDAGSKDVRAEHAQWVNVGTPFVLSVKAPRQPPIFNTVAS